MDAREMKIKAAEAALVHVEYGMRLGIGTGSTAEEFVRLLAEKVAAGFKVEGVPTSERTARLCVELGVPLKSLDELPQLDLTIDGADEVDAALRLIKGGGGALLREKIVAAASSRMIVIADESKLVETLGAFALPIEVNPFGLVSTRMAIEKTASRLAGHIIRGEAPIDEDQRTRRASVMSLVRDLVAAFSANDDGVLGLFGAFAYDLVFQIEDLVQKRARESDQRDIVLYVPDRLLAYDRATGRGVVLTYDFA